MRILRGQLVAVEQAMDRRRLRVEPDPLTRLGEVADAGHVVVIREQPAARVGVIAGGLLLVAGEGADALGEHPAVPQHLVTQ